MTPLQEQAKEYLKKEGVNHDWYLTKSEIIGGIEYTKPEYKRISVIMADFAEQYAEKEAIEFLEWFKTVGVEKAIEWDCVNEIYEATEKGAIVDLNYKKLYQKFKTDES